MGPEEGMASAIDSEENIADELAKLQAEIDFKTRKLADMRAENTRKSQELREKKSKLAAIKHFQKMKRVSITDFIDMTSKIAAAEGVIKAMTDTFNEVVKAYKGRMMKQVQDEYLNTVVLADVLRERGEELENDPTTNLVDFLRKEMPMEYGESEEWKKHLDEFPLD